MTHSWLTLVVVVVSRFCVVVVQVLEEASVEELGRVVLLLLDDDDGVVSFVVVPGDVTGTSVTVVVVSGLDDAVVPATVLELASVCAGGVVLVPDDCS